MHQNHTTENPRKWKDLDLAEIGRLCRERKGPRSMGKVRAKLAGIGCLTFGVFMEADRLRLLYASVAPDDDLMCAIEHEGLFYEYMAGEFKPKETGLSTQQIMDLVSYGHGISVMMGRDSLVPNYYYLDKASDKPGRNVPKNRFSGLFF